MADQRPHIVILGAGFAGLWTARGLKDAPARITVVDRSNHHLFQPLLYQVATAGLSGTDITAPIRKILHDHDNTTVIMAKAESIDTEQHLIRLADGTLSYDYLVVATGSTHSYFGNDAWSQYAPGLKTVEDALEVRRRVLLAYEAAEREKDASKRQALLTFVVVGGGPTGVELAGALAEIAHQTMASDFHNFDANQAKIVLAEAGPRLLTSFSVNLTTEAQEHLRRLGVEVRTGTPVTKIDETGVELDGERIPSRTVVWAAGVKANQLAESLPGEHDKGGRVRVERTLTIPEHDDVFVVGDLALLEQGGEPVPGLAQAAIQMGKHTAENLVRVLNGKPLQAFRYRDKGTMATIGRSAAVASIGRHEFSGFFAWLLWIVVHVALLIGFRNRLSVLLDWTWAYLFMQRSARVIVSTGDREPSLLREHRQDHAA